MELIQSDPEGNSSPKDFFSGIIIIIIFYIHIYLSLKLHRSQRFRVISKYLNLKLKTINLIVLNVFQAT